ncbi:hypothetical protein B1A85_04790 [Chroococcidiopsis sp. TS-821]|nr:hypothetical protein B1A85_04790 [Chroococcidiopsis sp. TS-821]
MVQEKLIVVLIQRNGIRHFESFRSLTPLLTAFMQLSQVPPKQSGKVLMTLTDSRTEDDDNK